MLLDRSWIAAHVPHFGNMCLLDRVESWDPRQILCIATSHRNADNPLRSNNRLAAVCGFEYAAQAMAVHGALLAGQQAVPKSGLLVSVRDAILHVERLDDIAAELVIQAHLMNSDGNAVMYNFLIQTDGAAAVEGRATVILNATESDSI